MAVTVEDVKIIAPELVQVDDAILSKFLADAAVTVCNATAWGAKLDLGQKYLAAHLCAVSRGAGNDGDLDSTRFGKEYQRLLRSLGTGFCTDYDGPNPPDMPDDCFYW
jgi:hypothetical protein